MAERYTVEARGGRVTNPCLAVVKERETNVLGFYFEPGEQGRADAVAAALNAAYEAGRQDQKAISAEYVALTDPLIACGPPDDPATGKCGTCRACALEAARVLEVMQRERLKPEYGGSFAEVTVYRRINGGQEYGDGATIAAAVQAWERQRRGP